MLSTHIFCSHCGVKNQKDAGFCFNCGNQLARPDANASTLQTPDNISGSDQQASASSVQVSTPPKIVREPPQPQEPQPPTTNPGNSTTPEINSATGLLSTNTILKQRYRVLHSVGRGGMGAVYMGEDMQLGHRLVAIKEMSLGSLDPREVQTGIDNFKREAHLLAGLQHPNLPSIYDHFEQNHRWYLVMSFIQGETLQDYMKYNPDGKLPLEEALKIGTELCSVLHYLHTYQPPIIFRDLKPSNIMRDKNGHIYLIDFGIARHFKPGQERDTASYATAGYAAPEQYGRAQTTPRSDIYSLGATLYYLLSGYAPSQSPFRLPPLQSLVPTLPPRLTRLITQMLDLEENRRPPDMMAVKEELQVITGSPATPKSERKSAQKQSVPKSEKEAARKRFSLKILGAIVVAVLGSVVALIGLVLSGIATWTVWQVYFINSYSSTGDFTSDRDSVSFNIIISSIVLFIGFFTFYVSRAKNLNVVVTASITNKRKAIARIGVFVSCILLVWGIGGWAQAQPAYSVHDGLLNGTTYTYMTLGFALIALAGIFTLLATTTKPFGLSHAKNKKEMAQRITTILATFVLLFGTTFLMPTTIVWFIVCFLVGGVVLITAQWRQ